MNGVSSRQPAARTSWSDRQALCEWMAKNAWPETSLGSGLSSVQNVRDHSDLWRSLQVCHRNLLHPSIASRANRSQRWTWFFAGHSGLQHQNPIHQDESCRALCGLWLPRTMIMNHWIEWIPGTNDHFDDIRRMFFSGSVLAWWNEFGCYDERIVQILFRLWCSRGDWDRTILVFL